MRKILIVILSLLISGVTSYGNEIIPAMKDGKMGYIDLKGNVILEFQFTNDFEVELIRTPGNDFYNFTVSDKHYFYDGIAFVKTPVMFAGLELWDIGKYIDTSGNELEIDKTSFKVRRFDWYTIREYQYKSFDYVFDTQYVYEYPNEGVLIDSLKNWETNENLDAARFEYAEPFSDDIALVMYNDSYIFIDTTGRWLGNKSFDIAKAFSEGFAPVYIDGKWGYIDKNGYIAIEPEFDLAFTFQCGVARIYQNGKYGYINKKGEKTIEQTFNYAGDFNHCIAPVKKQIYYEYINTEGKTAINMEFQFADDFKNGIARVKKNGKWGFISPDGKIVIPLEYDYALNFRKSFAKVWKNNQLIFINRKGEEFWTMDYEDFL